MITPTTAARSRRTDTRTSMSSRNYRLTDVVENAKNSYHPEFQSANPERHRIAAADLSALLCFRIAAAAKIAGAAGLV